jgi:RNA polymerase sigma-54 factor
MAITTKLELRQTHSLVMTPQLQQAIKLLQLSNIELASFVEAELERNPLLERDDADQFDGESSAAPIASDGRGGGDDAQTGDAEEAEWIDLEAGGARADDLDVEPQDGFPEGEAFLPVAL